MDSMHQPRDENGRFVDLKEFVELLVNERTEAHRALHTVEKEQLSEARRIVDDRLQQMNEFRGALEDQAGKMVTRELFDTLVDKVEELRRTRAFWAGGAAIAGFAISLILRLLGVTAGPS